MNQKVVVITGSTRGIGLGLAEALLQRGCRVVISSRTSDAVDKAIRQLQGRYPTEQVWGYSCDVQEYASVEALWEQTRRQFGHIDIWINNAGQSSPPKPFWEQEPESVAAIVDTNLLGSMNGARVALAGMLRQGHGQLFNFGGLGSNGMKVDGLLLYGSTKYAIQYFTDALINEVKGTPVQVGFVLPGMVITDLLLEGYNQWPDKLKQARRVFNILADRVETVAPWLADRILSVHKNGARIAWLTKPKIAWRFLTAPFHKRNLFTNHAH